MIQDHTLDQAILEALRFVKAAKALRATSPFDYSPRESAAAKRASMDLTRKLADLRQGR